MCFSFFILYRTLKKIIVIINVLFPKKIYDVIGCNLRNKKFEVMLTRRVKAYSSSCSQTVSLSPAISSQFILGVCATAEDCKK